MVNDENTEEWRAFRDGTYEASSLGFIRRAKPGIATFVGRPVNPIKGSTGYAQVGLRVDGANLRTYVHRVIAEAFMGPCPDGHCVNHKDGDKLNNAIANLEYVSYAENAQHAQRHLPRHRGPTKPKEPLKGPQTGDQHWSRRCPEKIARGERMGTSKLTSERVDEFRRRRALGEKLQPLADEFGISIAQASRIARGTRWAHTMDKGS